MEIRKQFSSTCEFPGLNSGSYFICPVFCPYLIHLVTFPFSEVSSTLMVGVQDVCRII